MPDEREQAADFRERFDVSRETTDLLGAFVGTLIKWNSSINLVSNSTIGEMWHRHITDSAQLMGLVEIDARADWLDVGSGGGLPGLVVAIMAKEKSPQTSFKLVESDGRKCAFLRQATRELDLNVEVIEDRIENTASLNADIISARAFASLPNLLTMADRHGAPDVLCLFLKGQNYNAELTAARQSWHMHVETVPSITDSSACILKIKDISRASEE